MKVFLGVDLGAESGRVMAGLWDGHAMNLEELHRFPNGGVQIGDTLRWDLPRLWNEIQHGLALAGKKWGASVVSVGVDTWGVDFVLLSKQDELLGLPYHYRDPRTRGVMDRTLKRVSRETIFQSTGLQFMEINTLFQLIAFQEKNPELLDLAGSLLMIPDFLHWCLSGEKVSEFTNATTTQFFDPTRRTWATGLLQKLGLPTNMLRPVVYPGQKIGRLRESLCARGLHPGVSVVAPASHDTGSAVAAVPTSSTGSPNWAYISSGTWSLMGLEIQDAALTPQTLQCNLTNEGGVDGTYRLLKNIMGLWLVQQCRKSFEQKGGEYSYDRLVHLAASAEPLRSLILPDDPSFLSPADMPQAIQAFCRRTGQPVPEDEGQFVRCALESLALKYAETLEALEAVAGQRIEGIHVVGGGSRNELLNQFTADACGRPVWSGPVEATALGNVLVQAKAAGEVASLSELRAVVKASTPVKVFQPRRPGEWQGARERFRKLGGETERESKV